MLRNKDIDKIWEMLEMYDGLISSSVLTVNPMPEFPALEHTTQVAVFDYDVQWSDDGYGVNVFIKLQHRIELCTKEHCIKINKREDIFYVRLILDIWQTLVTTTIPPQRVRQCKYSFISRNFWMLKMFYLSKNVAASDKLYPLKSNVLDSGSTAVENFR